MLAFAAVALWTVVWVNRELPVPAIGHGVSSSLIAWSFRIVVTVLVILVVTLPVAVLRALARLVV